MKLKIIFSCEMQLYAIILFTIIKNNALQCWQEVISKVEGVIFTLLHVILTLFSILCQFYLCVLLMHLVMLELKVSFLHS